jgi:phosphohistidine phosphatase SixA
MRLYLLRHAETAPGKKVHLRELTPKGIKSIRKLAGFLNKKELKEISEIRHSSHVSVRETAQAFQETAKLKAPIREVPLLEPCADFRILADFLDDEDETLLLVGHKPNLGMLASYLLTRGSRVDLFKIKKSGLLCLEKTKGEQTHTGWTSQWRIVWQLAPSHLKKAKSKR